MEFTITLSRHKGGRDRHLTWTGTAEGHEEAKLRAKRALAIACGAIAHARGLVPSDPPAVHLTTEARSHGESGLATWIIGPELLRHVGRAKSTGIEPPGFHVAWPWLKALAHEAFDHGRNASSYGIHFNRTSFSTVRDNHLNAGHWLMDGEETRHLRDADAVDDLIGLWTALAFSRDEAGGAGGAQTASPDGNVHSATLRAARALKIERDHAEALAAGRAWKEKVLKGERP